MDENHKQFGSVEINVFSTHMVRHVSHILLDSLNDLKSSFPRRTKLLGVQGSSTAVGGRLCMFCFPFFYGGIFFNNFRVSLIA